MNDEIKKIISEFCETRTLFQNDPTSYRSNPTACKTAKPYFEALNKLLSLKLEPVNDVNKTIIAFQNAHIDAQQNENILLKKGSDEGCVKRMEKLYETIDAIYQIINKKEI